MASCQFIAPTLQWNLYKRPPPKRVYLVLTATDTQSQLKYNILLNTSGGSRGGIGGQFPPSRSKIIKIHGIIIGSHSCNATLDSTSGLALQKLSLACI